MKLQNQNIHTNSKLITPTEKVQNKSHFTIVGECGGCHF